MASWQMDEPIKKADGSLHITTKVVCSGCKSYLTDRFVRRHELSSVYHRDYFAGVLRLIFTSLSGDNEAETIEA